MLHKILSAIDKISPIEESKAHCDIPCKIYDPSTAIIACLSVIRMSALIEEHSEGELTTARLHKLSRFISEKEKQGSILKEEIRIIWGDFFKAPQMEKFPEINELTHSIMLLASKSKQECDCEAARQLLDKVNRFAEIFWTCKGLDSTRVTCPYPPSLAVVQPVL